MYESVKLAHMALAGLSLLLFALRGGASLLISRPLRHPLWRVLPHAMDTLLLACGVWLAWQLRLDPFTTSWFGVKLLCVLIYIAFGILAFRLSGPRWLKRTLFVAALLSFAFIVSIALTHDPRGIFSRVLQ
ncbi:MAG TPA: SirB2 family protein [Gammaproteobacteria bacterium]|nr:SirB2 family protein [Gammaproteobacteria bacterium]